MLSAQFQLHASIEQRHWWFVARRSILRTLAAELVPPSPAKLVVDVGCGTGANIAAFAGEYECAGIDTSSEAIELAQCRFPDVHFVHGFAPRDLRGHAARADLFLLCDVLEHVDDDRSLISDLVVAAKPGAFLLVTVPADMTLWSQHDVSFGHFRRYDLNGFAALWSNLPVRCRLASYFNARLYPAIKVARTIGRFRGRSVGRAGTDFSMPPTVVNQSLAAAFASEKSRLANSLRTGKPSGFRRGVSLVAALERL